jgi:DNA-binding transcriptional LysR family regulator
MDLIDNIRIFKRVAELGSFSAASHEFKLNTGTVSKAVKALEVKFGVSLLRRTTRGLSLTSEGQKLLFSGGTLLEQAEAVFASVRNEKLQLQGQLRITASLAFSRIVLAPSLNQFSNLHPDLKLSFNLSDGFIDLVENGIDLAVRIGELQDSSLKALKVGISRRSLYASTEYIEKFGQPKTIEKLRDHRLLYYTRISDRPCWPLHAVTGEPKPFHFEPHFQSDGSDLMREMVLRGMGIALMPTWMMVKEEEQKKVVRLLERNSKSPSPVYAVSSSARELSAKQRAFTDFLLAVFETCPALNMRAEG